MIARIQGIAGRAAAARHDRLWPLGLLLVIVAFAAVLWNEPTIWIGDNRYELYVNPGRRIARMLSIWDTSRGLGRIRADFWPGVTIVIGFLRVVGFSPAVTEHIWHALLISTAGVGAAAMLRCLVPRVGWAHIVTALLYMFGPYTVGFLLPSNLYLNYAVAPWVFVLFYRGVHAANPWRWIGGLALVVFAMGNTEVSGLVYTFLYLIPLALHVVYVDRTTTWSRIVAWGLRFAVLAVGVSAVAIFTSVVGGEVFDQNLRETESATVLNGNSSWAESWRGLGSWLVYHRDTSGFARPATLSYLSSVPMILASFAAPAAAVAALGFVKDRARFLFGSLMMMGLLIMVGLYPLSDPSPYGDLVDGAYGIVPKLTILRNNYKAGSGAMLGVASLAGMMVAHLLALAGAGAASKSEVLEPDEATEESQEAHEPSRLSARLGQAGIVVAFLVVLAGISQPFWRSNLYNEAWELEDVPSYVTEAADWLDQQPTESRVLFLPRAYRNGFRWGWVNDDVLDTYLARPHTVEVPIHLSRPVPADLIASVDEALVNRLYREGDITSLARILGVDLVVLRNDHDWQTWDQPRPALFDELRNDPALERVAAFGELGENTTLAGDQSLPAFGESQLPPIEVYAVLQPSDIVRIEPNTAPLLVSGDGEAITQLSSYGVIDAFSGVRYTGRLDPDELVDALQSGSPLVVTDTNRRRVEVITTASQQSHTLAAGEELDREPFDLFDNPAAESVATYGEIAKVSASGTVAFTGGLQPWHRPAAALDGDSTTTWLVGGLSDPRGEAFRVDFVEPSAVSGIRVQIAEPNRSFGRRLSAATIAFSDGTVAAARFEDGIYSLDFEPREIEWITLTITGVSGSGLGPVGLAEVSILGADTRERIVTPRDVLVAAEESEELAALLPEAVIGYAFQRVIGEGPVDEERQFSRAFDALADGTFVVEGRLALSASTPESVLTALSGLPTRAVASSRLSGGLQFRGALAADGRVDTAWVASPNVGTELSLSFPRQAVSSVEILAQVGQGLSTVTDVLVFVGDEAVPISLPQVTCASPQCPVSISADVPVTMASELTIRVTGIIPTGQEQSNPIRISEAGINFAPNQQAAATTVTPCIDGLLEIDFEPVAIRMRVSPGEVFAGGSVPFVGCSPLQLFAGPRTIDNRGGAVIEDLLLFPPSFATPERFNGGLDRSGGSVVITHQEPTRMELDIAAVDGGWLSIGQSWHPAWTASLNGEDLGPPVELDTFAAWQLPAGSTGEIEIEFGLQRPFELAMLMSLIAVALSLWLVLRKEPTE